MAEQDTAATRVGLLRRGVGQRRPPWCSLLASTRGDGGYWAAVGAALVGHDSMEFLQCKGPAPAVAASKQRVRSMEERLAPPAAFRI